MRKKMNKAQSEMVGFAMIIIIVSVLLLIVLSLSFKKTNEDITESQEVEAFIQSFLTITTDCAKSYEPNYHSVRKLIFACNEKENCLDERDSCEVLNETLSKILENSWKVGEDWPIKGYLLNITVEGEELWTEQKGNVTNSNKGSAQSFEQGIDIIFIAYN